MRVLSAFSEVEFPSHVESLPWGTASGSSRPVALQESKQRTWRNLKGRGGIQAGAKTGTWGAQL
jgi:hypothetical protein